MSSGHLKRLVAPRSWNIARKERTWTTKPMPGKHSLESALPISTILRDYLKSVSYTHLTLPTNREV